MEPRSMEFTAYAKASPLGSNPAVWLTIRITLRKLCKNTDASSLRGLHAQPGRTLPYQLISKASANWQYTYRLWFWFFGQSYPFLWLSHLLSNYSCFLSWPPLPFPPGLKQLSFCLREYDSVLAGAGGCTVCQGLLWGFSPFLLTLSEI